MEAKYISPKPIIAPKKIQALRSMKLVGPTMGTEPIGLPKMENTAL
jgi:hypothetical protein